PLDRVCQEAVVSPVRLGQEATVDAVELGHARNEPRQALGRTHLGYADEARGAGADPLDRLWTGIDLLDVDTWCEVFGHWSLLGGDVQVHDVHRLPVVDGPVRGGRRCRRRSGRRPGAEPDPVEAADAVDAVEAGGVAD